MTTSKTRRLSAAFNKAVWGASAGRGGSLSVRPSNLARLMLVIGRDLGQGQLTLWAMSLVYTTLLSIVPLLALSFSVLKSFGVHNQIGPALSAFLAPLGDQAGEVSRRIVEFIANMKVGVLGWIGLLILVYTAISLMQKIETAFNCIWHVSAPRRLGERFTSYLSVLLIGPILVFGALGVTAAALNTEVVRAVLSVEPLGELVVAGSRLIPYLLVIGAFAFLYVFMPNTRVDARPAFAGALVAGVLWQTAGWAFALFAASATSYAAIYSSFAILILFMIWLYLSWLILLIGAAVVFYLQNPEYLIRPQAEPRLSNRMRERLALLVVGAIVERFLEGRPPCSVKELVRVTGVPTHSVAVILDALVQAGILARTDGRATAHVPARDPGGVSLKQVLDAVRAAGEEDYLSVEHLPVPAHVASMLARIDGALEGALGGVCVTELAGRPGPKVAGSPVAIAPQDASQARRSSAAVPG